MKAVSFPNNRPHLELGETRNTLESKTVMFTLILYLFISCGLLMVHYAGPYMPPAPALLEEAEAEKSGGITEGGRNIHESSSGSPHNPHLFRRSRAAGAETESEE